VLRKGSEKKPMFCLATIQGEFEMRVSAGSTKNFEEWMQMYEVVLSERVYKSLDSLERAGVATRSKTSLHVVDGYSGDAEQLYREDKLGCARGVIWALVFEAGLVVAALIYWKLRLFAR
jgi:hypothetical protein